MLIDGQYIQSSPGTTYNTDYFPNRLTLSFPDKKTLSVLSDDVHIRRRLAYLERPAT